MTLRRGWVVAIEFEDHVENGSQPVRFIVYGRISGISRTAISLDCWHYKNSRAFDRYNVTRYTILRSCIHSIKRLVEHGD